MSSFFDFIHFIFSKKKIKRKKSFSRNTVELVLMLIFVLGIRAFVFQPFKIPSESMYPTLLVGDYMIVSTGTYGYSKHSFPYSLPLLSKRVFYKEPKRGDIIVFRYPVGAEMGRWDRLKEDIGSFFKSSSHIPPDSYWIKRVVGLPGDRIQVKQGILYINGVESPQRRIADFREKMPSGRYRLVPQFVETLPNGVEHKILRESLGGHEHRDNTEEYIVPKDHFFLMGDNRNNSADSRSRLGPVYKDYLIGQPKIIVFSLDSGIFDLIRVWDWGDVIRGSRTFMIPSKLNE